MVTHTGATRYSLTSPPRTVGSVALAQTLRRRHQASRSNLSLGSKEGRLRATGPIERSLSGRHAGCTASVFVHQSLPPSGPAPSGRMLWDLKNSDPTASSALAVLHAVDVVIAPQPRPHRGGNAACAPDVPQSRHRATKRSNQARLLISPPADHVRRQRARYCAVWHQPGC